MSLKTAVLEAVDSENRGKGESQPPEEERREGESENVRKGWGDVTHPWTKGALYSTELTLPWVQILAHTLRSPVTLGMLFNLFLR